MRRPVHRSRAWGSVLVTLGAAVFAVVLLDMVSLLSPRGGRIAGDVGGAGLILCEGTPIPVEYAYPGAGGTSPECAFQCSLIASYFLVYTDTDGNTQRLRAFSCAKGVSCDPADGGLGEACDSGMAAGGALMVDVLFRSSAGSVPPSAAASSSRSSQDAITAWHPAPASSPSSAVGSAASSSAAPGPFLPLRAFSSSRALAWQLGLPVFSIPSSSVSAASRSPMASSLPEARCGDGKEDAGEGCDAGVRNGIPGAFCTGDCKRTAGCGNGVIDEGEQCDDGSDNGTDAGTCTSLCQVEQGILPRCGDGSLGVGEECDAGLRNGVPGGACGLDCRVVRQPPAGWVASVSPPASSPPAAAQTGPAALLIMVFGAAIGFVWMRRRRG